MVNDRAQNKILIIDPLIKECCETQLNRIELNSDIQAVVQSVNNLLKSYAVMDPILLCQNLKIECSNKFWVQAQCLYFLNEYLCNNSLKINTSSKRIIESAFKRREMIHKYAFETKKVILASNIWQFPMLALTPLYPILLSNIDNLHLRNQTQNNCLAVGYCFLFAFLWALAITKDEERNTKAIEQRQQKLDTILQAIKDSFPGFKEEKAEERTNHFSTSSSSLFRNTSANQASRSTTPRRRKR